MKKKIIVFPHPPGHGGPGSFQKRFEASLKNLGWTVKYHRQLRDPSVVFIVGGTRKLIWLILLKLRGVPIIYRLDGINWLHRKRKAGRSVSHFITSELINGLSKFIHGFIANKIIYQSKFVEHWWDKSGWIKRDHTTIIQNGIDLETFTKKKSLTQKIRLLCLEGLLDYSPFAIKLINKLYQRLTGEIELVIYGGIKFPDQEALLDKRINYLGRIAHAELPQAYQNTIYLSLDVNAACPNTVIEALACGAPVVGFDTGALRELVPPSAGIIVPYGSDPWELGFPDVDALVTAIRKVKESWQEYSEGARAVAEERYNLNDVTSQYLAVIEKAIKQ